MMQDGLCTLFLADTPMGLLLPDMRDALLRTARASGLDGHCAAPVVDKQIGIHIGHSNTDAQTLATTLTQLAASLRDAGLIKGWRDESFSVRRPDGRVWFALERACFRAWGLISQAVHAHAWCNNGDTWLGRRALHKATDPGLLDNLAAGGLTHGELPFDCMVRELWEEAGVPAEMAMRVHALPDALFSQRREVDGIHREVLHCYTLHLPDEFIPCNQDGEVSGFIRCDTAQLLAYASRGELTADARLCVDLALRRGPV
jgi:8-oxo-dGTP pyrophosphatase MutT (NUDIX family)